MNDKTTKQDDLIEVIEKNQYKNMEQIKLEGVLELIENGWTQDADARNIAGAAVHPDAEDACQFCTIGAVKAMTAYPDHHEDPHYMEIEEMLANIIEDEYPEYEQGNYLHPEHLIEEWNDHHERTKNQVVNIVYMTLSAFEEKN